MAGLAAKHRGVFPRRVLLQFFQIRVAQAVWRSGFPWWKRMTVMEIFVHVLDLRDLERMRPHRRPTTGSWLVDETTANSALKADPVGLRTGKQAPFPYP